MFESFTGLFVAFWKFHTYSTDLHTQGHKSNQKIFEKFPHFPGKLALCAKLGQNWFCWDFKVLPPSYVTFNQNFSPIPQIYTPNTNILTRKNFWKIYQFSRKNLHCLQNWYKNGFAGMSKCYPLAM